MLMHRQTSKFIIQCILLIASLTLRTICLIEPTSWQRYVTQASSTDSWDLPNANELWSTLSNLRKALNVIKNWLYSMIISCQNCPTKYRNPRLLLALLTGRINSDERGVANPLYSDNWAGGLGIFSLSARIPDILMGEIEQPLQVLRCDCVMWLHGKLRRYLIIYRLGPEECQY